MARRDISLFLIITFVWSWGFWAIPYLAHRGVELPTFLSGLVGQGGPAAWGPLIGALIVAFVRGGPGGVLSLMKRGFAFRFAARWYLIAFLTSPLLIGLSYLVGMLEGDGMSVSEAMQNPAIIPIAFVVILLTGGPLQEEFGWRGTLLDPLQARFGALWASLMVGAIWGAWHIPLFLFPNDAGPYYGRPFWGLMITTMLISVLFTWIWNNTGRSLLAVMIFHTMFNLTHWALPVLGSDLAALVLFGLQILAVGAVIMRFGARNLSRHL
ncbi:MAG: type II CAAX endopeptidase family protein [Maritimibacter sp.]